VELRLKALQDTIEPVSSGITAILQLSADYPPKDADIGFKS